MKMLQNHTDLTWHLRSATSVTSRNTPICSMLNSPFILNTFSKGISNKIYPIYCCNLDYHDWINSLLRRWKENCFLAVIACTTDECTRAVPRQYWIFFPFKIHWYGKPGLFPSAVWSSPATVLKAKERQKFKEKGGFWMPISGREAPWCTEPLQKPKDQGNTGAKPSHFTS